MTDSLDGHTEIPLRRLLWPRLVLLGIWTVATLWLVSQHVMWRDEVRALSIALQGDNVFDMVWMMQGEGHPVIWYLLLRFAHMIVPANEVLPAVGWLVAFAAMAILVLKSPFRLGTIALILFGGFGLFEYVVSARNYGISMLVLFATAALYPRYRDRGVVIGVMLALLCNTNVHAAFFAACLLGFWLIEITCEEGLRWTRKHSRFALAVVSATIGAALCFFAIYPPYQDAAVKPHPDGITLSVVLQALLSPADAFAHLMPYQLGHGPIVSAILTILLVGAVAGLARSPAALLSAAAVMIADQLFMQLVYPGDYRHKAMFLVYLATLYWLVAAGRGGRWPDRLSAGLGRIATLGGLAFSALLALQIPLSITLIRAELSGIPQSRAADLAAVLREQGLTAAPMIANADVIMEPVPYYSDNPLWLLRENKFGKVVRFTRDARIHIDLDTLLEEAGTLHRGTGKPVVILMQFRLEPGQPSAVSHEAYGGSFSMPTDQVDRFLSQTRRIARFDRAITDEYYDVYVYPGS